jgi:hypothetical protein
MSPGGRPNREDNRRDEMSKWSIRTVACALLAVALWAGAASSGSAEPVGAEHGWIEEGVGPTGGPGRDVAGGCAGPPQSGGASAIGPCTLEWRVRGLLIGGAGQAAEHLRRRLPIVSAIVAEQGSDLGHLVALLTRNVM